MFTTGKGTHYCQYCGFDMAALEERECPVCDGDYCIAKKYPALKDLKADHPRIVEAKKQFSEGGCRHRPKCDVFKKHLERLR